MPRRPFILMPSSHNCAQAQDPRASERRRSPRQARSLWAPDVDLTPEAAGRLIGLQFPALGTPNLTPKGKGWDNTAYLVNDAYVFRFPRRAIAAQLLANEIRILPLLAPRLPARVPEPLFVGTAADGYPYPFAGCELVPGRAACERGWSVTGRRALARALARFLRTLHGIRVDGSTPTWAPGDELRRADVVQRAAKVRTGVESLAPGIPGVDVPGLLRAIDRAVAAEPYAGPAAWVHGDLYSRHIIVDESGGLSGIIDWGDVHLGDPALDLSIAFSFLSPASRRAFREDYGPIDEAMWDRARFRAIHYGVILREYGLAVGDEVVTEAGLQALRFAGR